MTASFSHLKKLEVDAKSTCLYTFHEILGEPVLECHPATEQNAPYYRTVMKQAAKTAMRVRSGTMSPAMIAEAREQDRDLFPKHVIKDWPTPPLDSEGEPAAATVENFAGFLEALPDYMFDKLRVHLSNPSNFVDDDEITLDEAGDLAGNS